MEDWHSIVFDWRSSLIRYQNFSSKVWLWCSAIVHHQSRLIAVLLFYQSVNWCLNSLIWLPNQSYCSVGVNNWTQSNEWCSRVPNTIKQQKCSKFWLKIGIQFVFDLQICIWFSSIPKFQVKFDYVWQSYMNRLIAVPLLFWFVL